MDHAFPHLYVNEPKQSKVKYLLKVTQPAVEDSNPTEASAVNRCTLSSFTRNAAREEDQGEWAPGLPNVELLSQGLRWA